MEVLRQAVDSYSGKTPWTMSGRKRDGLFGINWLIRPRRVIDVESAASSLDLTPDQYFAQHEPEFGPIAYDDLEGLVRHVRQAFLQLPNADS